MDVYLFITNYVMANGRKACSLVKKTHSWRSAFFVLYGEQSFEITLTNK